ncbi:kinase-like domain-containing protein [Xylariales sp. PMI_506]|nr:kinase-like domain-containing protein [Xylariales sp. PMI_506]
MPVMPLAQIHCVLIGEELAGYKSADSYTGTDQPFVYIRDCGSLSGTQVNGCKLGSIDRITAPGYLLNAGDVVYIRPYWRFEVQLPAFERWSCPLTTIQFQEAQFFSDRYSISNRVIGTGSFGTVRLATEMASGRQLTCKIVDLRKFWGHQNRGVLNQLVREAEILGKIRHPNILSFESAFRSRNTMFIFTELACGGDLFSMLSSRGEVLSEGETRFVMNQVVRGIAYLHSHGLAHRDVKPENIFFASGPDLNSRVIIGDLGSSKAAAWGEFKSAVGTELYQAPEVYSHCVAYSEAIDLWAVGIMILYIFSPKARDHLKQLKTFDQDIVDVFLNQACNFQNCYESMSDSGRDFVRKCLRVDPKDRITASEAKKHLWICPSENIITEWTRLRNALWRPRSSIPSLVEDLPEPITAEQTTSKDNLTKWSNILMPNSQVDELACKSSYF